MRRRQLILLGVGAFLPLLACNLKPLMPFLPKTPAERLRANPVVLSRSCTSCHTIGDTGGTVGPVLNEVASRRTRDWLETWLRDPQAVKPGTKMPNFGFTDEELATVLNDLLAMRRETDPKAILEEVRSPEEAGRRLFEAYDCYACHRIGRTGRYNGPDLTWVGKWQDMAWEKNWLANPSAQRPGTFMPTFGLSGPEIEALTAFLGTLKGQQHAEDQRWKDPAYRNKPVKRGEFLFEKLGCRGCHGERGTAGGFHNPNAAPDESVPALTQAAARYDEAALRRIILGSKRPQRLDPQGPEPPLACPSWADVLAENELDDVVAYVKSLGPQKSKWNFR